MGKLNGNARVIKAELGTLQAITGAGGGQMGIELNEADKAFIFVLAEAGGDKAIKRFKEADKFAFLDIVGEVGDEKSRRGLFFHFHS